MGIFKDMKIEILQNRYKKIYVLSYGGGVNSSALFFYLIQNNYPIDLVIFADTGDESNETYDAVTRMKKECNKYNIKFVIVESKYKTQYGSLNDYYYAKKAIPSLMKRDCTSKFKISPIRQYLRSTYGKQQKFVMYIGIASNEISRMRKSDVNYMEFAYPFCYDNIDRIGNEEILKKNNFKATKSGCKGCIFLKKKQWIEMIKIDLKEFERWERLEKNNSKGLKYNGNYSLVSLKESTLSEGNLMDYLKDDDDDDETYQTCNSIHGGCML